MIFSWFNAAEAERFGESLAEFFMQRIPLDAPKGKNKTMQKKAEVLSKIFLQIEKFKQEQKLNVYKKAKVGNTFKWRLKEAGYDSGFVDELTHALMQKL